VTSKKVDTIVSKIVTFFSSEGEQLLDEQGQGLVSSRRSTTLVGDVLLVDEHRGDDFDVALGGGHGEGDGQQGSHDGQQDDQLVHFVGD